jgi:hypothetical protein
MEEKIIEILERNFTESIEFDREKAKDELLALFDISKSCKHENLFPINKYGDKQCHDCGSFISHLEE